MPRATWASPESQDRRDGRETPASKAQLDSQDLRVFLVSKERRVNLEPTGEKGPPAWPARMEPTGRRASWGALDLLAAREIPGVRAPKATPGKPATLGSKETEVPRGMLAAQVAEGPLEMMGPQEVRGTKAATDPLEVPA